MLPPSRFRFWVSIMTVAIALVNAAILSATYSVTAGAPWFVIAAIFGLNAHLSRPRG